MDFYRAQFLPERNLSEEFARIRKEIAVIHDGMEREDEDYEVENLIGAMCEEREKILITHQELAPFMARYKRVEGAVEVAGQAMSASALAMAYLGRPRAALALAGTGCAVQAAKTLLWDRDNFLSEYDMGTADEDPECAKIVQKQQAEQRTLLVRNPKKAFFNRKTCLSVCGLLAGAYAIYRSRF